MNVIEYILSTIAPHECLGCGVEGSVLCTRCSQALPIIPERCYRCLRSSAGYRTCKACRSHSALHDVYAFTEYDGSAKELLHKLKFERLRAGALSAANLMARQLTAPNMIVTHVPTATSRVRQRGYDQAALLARRVALNLNAEYTPLLARLGQQRQVGKNRSERQKQMQTLFITIKKQPPHYVLLIDDVITTGATLEACARVLKAAGVKRVSAAVFAAA